MHVSEDAINHGDIPLHKAFFLLWREPMLVEKGKKKLRSFLLDWITETFLGICDFSMTTKLRHRDVNVLECFITSVITLKAV